MRICLTKLPGVKFRWGLNFPVLLPQKTCTLFKATSKNNNGPKYSTHHSAETTTDGYKLTWGYQKRMDYVRKLYIKTYQERSTQNINYNSNGFTREVIKLIDQK
jgi:hypothetical protein